MRFYAAAAPALLLVLAILATTAFPLAGSPALAVPLSPRPSVGDPQSSPLLFIENAGQFADGARFQARGGDRTLWLADDAIWVTAVEQQTESGMRSKTEGRDVIHRGGVVV